MHPRIREEVAVPLEPDPERRGDHRLPRDRQAMQRVVEAERETGDEHRRSHFDLVELLDQVSGREGVIKECVRRAGRSATKRTGPR